MFPWTHWRRGRCRRWLASMESSKSSSCGHLQSCSKNKSCRNWGEVAHPEILGLYQLGKTRSPERYELFLQHVLICSRCYFLFRFHSFQIGHLLKSMLRCGTCFICLRVAARRIYRSLSLLLKLWFLQVWFFTYRGSHLIDLVDGSGQACTCYSYPRDKMDKSLKIGCFCSVNRHDLVGGLEPFSFFHILGMSSSQSTKSYFSEGFVNHQPDDMFLSFL